MVFGLFRMSVVLSRVLSPLRGEIASLGVGMRSLQAQVQFMSTALDNLKAAVTAQVSVDQSAVTLIQGIAEQLKGVSDDADVQALADELTAAAAPLSAAVTAHVPPSAPAVPPAVAPASATPVAPPTPAP
jgi:hypothetical protein